MYRKDEVPEVPTIDMTALLEECYSRVPKLGGEIVTVEALVDCLYCSLDPGLTAPLEIQRLALRQLDEFATKFRQKRDGAHYRIFDDEGWYWIGRWIESEKVPYHIRTWVVKEMYRA